MRLNGKDVKRAEPQRFQRAITRSRWPLVNSTHLAYLMVILCLNDSLFGPTTDLRVDALDCFLVDRFIDCISPILASQPTSKHDARWIMRR